MQKQERLSGIILLFILIVSYSYCAITVSELSSSPTTVNTSASLLLSLSRDSQMPVDFQIKITLPSQVSIGSSLTRCQQTLILNASMNCAVSGRQITITLIQKISSSFAASFQVGPITNPGSTQPTSNFFVQGIPAGSGETPQTATLSATAALITGATFQSQSSNTVGQDSTAILQFKNVNTIPANGKIQIRFPQKWNPNSLQANRKSYFTNTLSCTSFTPSGIFGSCSLNQDTVTLTVVSQIEASTDISFTVSSIRNPRSARSVTGLTLRTQNSNNFKIDQMTNLSLSSRTTYAPRSFDSSRVKPFNQVVGQKTNAQFEMTISSFPVQNGIYAEVLFPTEILPNTIKTITGSNPALSPSFTTTGRTVRITNIQNRANQQFSGVFHVNQIVNPSSTAPVTSFQFRLYDSLNNIIAEKTTGISYTPAVGSLSSLSIVPDSTQVSTVTSWKFSMTISSSLPAVSQIRITVPSQITLTSSSCTLSQVTTISNLSNCAISGQVITLTNILSASIPATTVIQFKTSAVITNPITTGSIGAAIFETRTPGDGAHQVNLGQLSNFFTVTTGAMSSATVTPSPAIAYQETTLTISMRTGHPYPQVTTILINLPSQLTLLELNPTCTSSTSLACTTPNNSSIRVITSMSSVLAASSTITIVIQKVRNQRTLSPTSTFTFTTQNIQSLSSGVFSSISSVPSLNSFTVAPASFINSAVTTYTFSSVITNTLLLDNDYITITPQTTVRNPTGSITCSGTSSNLDSVSCALSGSGVRVTLNFKTTSNNRLSPGQTLSFTIAGYRNPTTTDAPSDNFSLLIEDSTGSDVASYSDSSFRVQTNTAATMTANSSNEALLTLSTLVPKFTETTYTIKARTVTTIPANSVIRISIPSGVVVTTAPSTTCRGTGVVDSNLTCNLINSNTVFQISNGFSTQKTPGDFSVEMSNIQNPQRVTTTPSFGIEIFTSTGGIVD